MVATFKMLANNKYTNKQVAEKHCKPLAHDLLLANDTKKMASVINQYKTSLLVL